MDLDDIYIMMDINEHQDQRYTRGDNNGRDLHLLGVNVLVSNHLNSRSSNNLNSHAYFLLKDQV